MNWRDEINSAKIGTSSGSDLVPIANKWNSCAIGERRELLEAIGREFTWNDEPLDPNLLKLGLQFCEAVFKFDWDWALAILDELDRIITVSAHQSSDSTDSTVGRS